MNKDKKAISQLIAVRKKVPEPIKSESVHGRVLLGLVCAELLQKPNEIRLTIEALDGYSFILLESQTRGFSKVNQINSQASGDILRFMGLSQTVKLKVGSVRYACNSSKGHTSFFKDRPKLREGFGFEYFEEMVSSTNRASGVMYLTGNTKSSLNTCFYALSERIMKRHENWLKVMLSDGVSIIQSHRGERESQNIVTDIQMLKPTLVLLDEPSNLAQQDIFNIAKSGTLVLVKQLGGNTLNTYSELMESISYVDLSNHMIGVGATNLLPLIKDPKSVGSAYFGDNPEAILLKSLEVSIQPDDEVLVYGKDWYDSSVIRDYVDLVDFIEAPKSFRLYIEENGSSADLYPIFKNKNQSLNLCLDMAASLMRTKEASIDLIGRFITSN